MGKVKTLDNLSKKSFKVKIVLIIYGVITFVYLGFLYFFSKNEISETLKFLIIAIGLISAFISKSLLPILNDYKYTSKVVVFKSILFYLLNIIVLPITVGYFTYYIEKQTYPMVYLFRDNFSYEMCLYFIVLFTPYFLVMTLVIHFYHYSQISEEKIGELTYEGEVSSIQFQQLKTQLNPHFLFNNISVLTSLIEEDSKKAIQFSENLSNVYRYLVYKEKKDLVLLSDELNFAIKYLELIKVKYGDIFHCKIDKMEL
ncbi:MAG: histidine kinase [Flavobacteriaceae bacterium]